MRYLLECVIGTLAAVGFICILKTVYDIIKTSYFRTNGSAELYLYGSGTSPESEQLLNCAEQVRRLYLPGLNIIFVETEGMNEGYNYAQAIAARRAVTYIK